MDNRNGGGVTFKGIEERDLAILEKWYGMTDYFGYATGFKDFSSIKQRLLQLNNYRKLASMIHVEGIEQPVGFIYGEIKTIDKKIILWIHILIIDPAYQHRGIGTCAVNKLLNIVSTQFGSLTCIAAVSDQNKKGLSFWSKAGFSHSPDMEESLHQSGSHHVSIFKRIIS